MEKEKKTIKQNKVYFISFTIRDEALLNAV